MVETNSAHRDKAEAVKRMQSRLHTKSSNQIEDELNQTAPTAETSPRNALKQAKKELAVWDALVLADQNRFKKEAERATSG